MNLKPFAAVVALLSTQLLSAQEPSSATIPAGGTEAITPPTLNCSPTEFCLVALQPGERLRGVAILDPSWKSVTLSSGQVGSEKEVVQVLLWPAAWGATSSLAITSDRETYLVRLTSDSGAPIRRRLTFAAAKDDTVRFEASALSAVGTPGNFDPTKLHHRYRVTGRRGAPTVVYDDGQRTFIGWTENRPPEAPVVIGHDESGVASLLSPHVSADGIWYVVDAVLPRMELRVGTKTTAVIINRGLQK